MKTASKFAALRFGGLVKRFHTHDMITTVRNSEHSWGVAVLLALCYPSVSKNAIVNAILHDCAEVMTGDIPSPAKKSRPELKQVFEESEVEFNTACGVPDVNNHEHNCIKVCDYIDMLLHCYREHGLGNSNVEKIAVNCMNLISRYEQYGAVSADAWSIICLTQDRFPFVGNYVPDEHNDSFSQFSLDKLSPLEFGLGGLGRG